MPLQELNDQDIRVLIIEPGEGDDPICCGLVPSSLASNIESPKTQAYPFTALSYFWGEGEPIHEITVESYLTPEKKLEHLSEEEITTIAFRKSKTWSPHGTVYVRSNLFVALKRFRRKRKRVKMWIDALCIDQSDMIERSEQVKKMHELYLHADNVCIWLGDGTGEDAPDPNECFRFLQRLLDLKSLEGLFAKGSKDNSDLAGNLVDIVSLMCNKWFSRRWVLQEIALARKAKVVYGKAKMLWSDFADAIAIFIKSQDTFQPILLKRLEEDAAFPQEVEIADNVKNLCANELVEFTNNFFRRSQHGDIQQRTMTLEFLVSSLLAFEATDPRDTIYAVLSLAKDTYRPTENLEQNPGFLDFDPRLSPDYKKKCLLDVYTDFIDYCIDTSKSLDILLRHWAPTWKKESREIPFSIPSAAGENHNEEEDLPSWIPLIQNSSHGAPAQRPRGRSNGDSFVGAPHRASYRNYSATLDHEPEYSFGRIPLAEQSSKRVYDGHLSVKGLRIGKVGDLAPRAAYGIIFKEAFQIAGFDRGWWEGQGQQEWAEGVTRVPEAFWRTIVADRDPNGQNPPAWYSRACMDCLKHLNTNGALNPDNVFGLPKASPITKTFLDRVKDVVWERRFVRVKLKGRTETYGLVPAETKKSDRICVLFGCSVPVVLRRSRKGGQGQFTMVGECFIYGMMDGEAVSGKS